MARAPVPDEPQTSLPREVFPGHAGEIMSFGCPGSILKSFREELEEVSGAREV